MESDKKVLVGINITNTLAGFFNSGGETLPKDPYLFSLKLLKDNKIWRLGGNFKIETNKEELPNFDFRNTQESALQLKLGREWLQPVSERFTIYYGVDLVGNYYKEKSSFDSFSSLKSSLFRTGGGAGPFLGIYFTVTNRIWLSTESYAYAIFTYGESITEIGQGLPDQITKQSKFSVLPAIPNSLYVHFSF